MKIFTSNPGGQKLKEITDRDMGILIPSVPGVSVSEKWSQATCALDNGEFSCWNKGYPFLEKFFLETLIKCYVKKVTLEFIVCPDLVAGGQDSLEFSLKWKQERLCGAPNLALAVQDGMTPKMIHDATADVGFKYIFVGGTLEWKWKTAKEWVIFAHDHGLKCHIGRVGSENKLDFCHSINADSTDSSSFVRNDTFHIVDNYRKKKLF
jgi:hypothetical protein